MATNATAWLDMRSPSLLTSPWVSMGRLIHDADGLPFPNASTPHFHMRALVAPQHWTIFDIPNYLTRCDEWAGDFSKELDLTAPRTYCPLTHRPTYRPTGVW